MRYLIIILLLSSCSANWHIKRAVKKDPSILVKDTIVVTDSIHVVTEKISHDSIFKVSKDTVILQKDKLTIKHYYHNDSVYIYGECESDTIIRFKELKVPYEKIVYKDKNSLPVWIWLPTVIAFVFYLIFRFLKYL